MKKKITTIAVFVLFFASLLYYFMPRSHVHNSDLKSLSEIAQAKSGPPEIVYGYTLPPEPNKQLNDSTLLGIDANHNDIRDDIERKIVFKYKEPVKIELMFAYARANQEMLHNPVGSAMESEAKMSRVGDCEMYLINQKVNLGETLEYIEANMYNTKARVIAYLKYNQALSGGVYGSSADDWNAKACDFDVDKLLKEQSAQ